MQSKKYKFPEAFEDPILLKEKQDLLLPKNSRANLLMQFMLLFQRNFICMRRNYVRLYFYLPSTFYLTLNSSSPQKILLSRLIAHAVIGSIFGYLYLNVGAMATTVLGNYVYMYGSMLLVVYTGKMSVMMSCKFKKIPGSWPMFHNKLLCENKKFTK